MLIPIPDLREARRLLCVQPHYDDNDIGAGGTLACLSAGGAELHYLTVADDLLGVLDPGLDDGQALSRIRAEQSTAGSLVGVVSQQRLEYPDAGAWDHLALRRAIVAAIRTHQPDFLVTVDPWLPGEAHLDHVRTGLAAAEAVLLHGLPRVASEPDADGAWLQAGSPSLRGVAFYFTARPNTFFDIGPGRQVKHSALDTYVSQFTSETLRQLHEGLEVKEREWGERAGCHHAEALRVVHPAHLHCNPDAEEMEAR